VDAEVPGRRCPGRGGTPQPAVLEDLLDDIGLGWLDERDHFHHPAAFGVLCSIMLYLV
jgi:hypothetical protein